jgi:predicted TIM-barrel fold metal-dependent hydrolase
MESDIAAIDRQLEIARFAINDAFSPGRDQDPVRRRRYHTLISVDDHLVEPPDLFMGRLPAKFRDRTPRVIETGDGAQAWLLDGNVLPQIAINAVAGRPVEQQFLEPTRFGELRLGMWNIDKRVQDMDVDGVYASLNFPSMVGFAGVRLTMLPDTEFVLALVRAWNDWHLEEWAGAHPDRIIPCQIVYLAEVDAAAAGVRLNAERGFHALSFPESPSRVGLPSLHSGYWDPLWAVCEETGTVVCLHAGSSGMPPGSVDPEAPQGVLGPMFAISQCLNTTIDWLYSRIPIKFPDIKICLSEGGIGWVVGLLDRLDHAERSREYEGVWADSELTPPELLLRNFWFCMLDDPTSLRSTRDRIGVDNIVLEVDYPHSDASWPDTQEKWRRQFAGLPEQDVRLMAWENASKLFSHPVPKAVQDDPDAF